MTRLLHITTAPINLDQLLGPQPAAFIDAGFEVFTASGHGVSVDYLSTHPVRGDHRASGVRHHVLSDFDGGVDVVAELRAAKSLKALLDEIQPDILHVHGSRPTALGQLVGRMSRVPIVVNSVHSDLTPVGIGLRRRAANHGMGRIAVAQSEAEFVHNLSLIHI